LIVLIAGSTVVLIGVALLVLPGPGILTILIGLGILGTEFLWAKKLYNRIKDRTDTIKRSIF